jgi:adenosine kinase
VDIVITGSVAYDYLMSFPGYFKEHILPEHIEKISLSFLVDTMERRRGGIAPNIAYTLALFGERPRLLAAVGKDFQEYRHWLESHGVDTRGAKVIPGVFTASFFANTDLSNAQIATFYPGAMAFASQLHLTDLDGGKPDLVVISPNDPQAMTQYVHECRQLDIPYLYDPSQQIVRLTPEELKEGIDHALALFVNEYEFALVQKMTAYTPEEITQRVRFMVVTCGERGAELYADQQQYHIPAIHPEKVADPTGVGDAFRGGFLAAYARGLDWATCGQVGALAATYCLEQHGTQGHCYTPQEFTRRFRQYFNDQGKLDVFLTNP